MRIQYEGLALPVSKRFIDALIKAIEPHREPLAEFACVNFRDPKYSAEEGGYHPVEILLTGTSGRYDICYITDFCYAGIGDCAELVKSLDFEFIAGTFQDMTGYYPIEVAREIYPIWEDNFLTYWLDMGVFEVEVS